MEFFVSNFNHLLAFPNREREQGDSHIIQIYSSWSVCVTDFEDVLNVHLWVLMRLVGKFSINVQQLHHTLLQLKHTTSWWFLNTWSDISCAWVFSVSNCHPCHCYKCNLFNLYNWCYLFTPNQRNMLHYSYFISPIMNKSFQCNKYLYHFPSIILLKV